MRPGAAQYHPLKERKYSPEQQISNGFLSFVNALLGNKNKVAQNEKKENPQNKNYFFEKYQQLLINGKTGNVQVIHVKKKNAGEMGRNTIVYLTFKIISARGVRLYNAAAMATRENTPAINTIISIFYNPADTSVIVLL